MTETLIDIDGSNSNPPQTPTVKGDEDQELKIKKWFTSLVLTPEQQEKSLNSRPYFMTVVTVFRIYVMFTGISIYFDKNMHKTNSERFLVCAALLTSRVLVHLFVGIPLEIAYGTLETAIFYMISIIYPHIVGEIILSKFDFVDCDPCAFALVGFVFANIVRNWSTFPSKFIRSIALIGSGILFDVYIIKRFFDDSVDWRIHLFRLTCGLAGVLFGFLTGFFWTYRNQAEDKEETPYRSYAIVATVLVAYLIAAEFSGLHVTYEDWRIAKRRGY